MRAGKLTLIRPRQRIMSPLAANTAPTGVHTTLNCNPAAAPRTEDDTKHDTYSGSGSIGGLRHHQTIRIVGHTRLTPKCRAEISIEGQPIQPDRIRILNQ